MILPWQVWVAGIVLLFGVAGTPHTRPAVTPECVAAQADHLNGGHLNVELFCRNSLR